MHSDSRQGLSHDMLRLEGAKTVNLLVNIVHKDKEVLPPPPCWKTNIPTRLTMNPPTEMIIRRS